MSVPRARTFYALKKSAAQSFDGLPYGTQQLYMPFNPINFRKKEHIVSKKEPPPRRMPDRGLKNLLVVSE